MNTGNPIRIFIVDDHEIMRSGLVSLIDDIPNMVVVGEASNGCTAIELVCQHQPNVILLDISLGDMSGISAIKYLLANAPDARILILTMHQEKVVFFQALQAGAAGYFLKGNPTNELFGAIEAIARGGVYLPPQLASELVNDYLKRCRINANKAELTAREEEVVSYLAKGFSNQEIASQLTLSPSTVKVHRYNIFQKLKLHNRSELLAYAKRHGILGPT